MKIACISDTHGELIDPTRFQGADLILHAGDIGPDRNVQQWINQTFRPWLQTIEDLEIEFYATLGNHDNPLEWSLHRDLPIECDELVVAGGYKIWFSPWSPQFGHWHWMTDESRLSDKYRQIPDDCDIIVSHSPMFQACDANVGGTLCGSKALRVRVRELTPKTLNSPIVICGHIHEAHGQSDLGFAEVFNVASVDEYYQQRKEPITWLEL